MSGPDMAEMRQNMQGGFLVSHTPKYFSWEVYWIVTTNAVI